MYLSIKSDIYLFLLFGIVVVHLLLLILIFYIIYVTIYKIICL